MTTDTQETMTLETTTTLSRRSGAVEARMTRRFDHAPDEVWRFLTEPALLAQWLAPGKIGLEIGGEAALDFQDSGIVIRSKVTAFVPGRVLEYSWSSPGEPLRPLRWDVEPDGDGARLSLSLSIPEGEDAARSCAGFDAHLEMLAAALEGVPIKFPFLSFKAAREVYAARLEKQAR